MPGVQLEILSMPGVQLETLVEASIVEAAVPVEAGGCTWPVPVETCTTTLVTDTVNLTSRKRPSNDSDSQAKHYFSSNTDSRAGLKRYKSEKITDHCHEKFSETMKTGRNETVEVRERIESILDQFLADYKPEEDTKAPQFNLEEEEEEEKRGINISEEESIENIQKFLDEWNQTPPAAILN